MILIWIRLIFCGFMILVIVLYFINELIGDRYDEEPPKGSKNTDGDKNTFTQVNDNL